jgi:hypothetical protein
MPMLIEHPARVLVLASSTRIGDGMARRSSAGFSQGGARARSAARLAAVAGLLAGLQAVPAAAGDFRLGRTEGLLDFTIAYGVLVRTEEADDDLIALSSGGDAPSSNYDDGNLNYDTGIASNMVRATGELTLQRGGFGAYVRGYALYDYENDERDRERTSLSGDAKDAVGRDADLLDAYVTWRVNWLGMPVRIRIGDQVINWGETLFVRDGIDVINPVDFVAAFQPASTAQDLFVPQGMVWAAASVTEHIALEGYYQYEWEPARLPPVGTLFSANDAFDTRDMNAIFLGAGRVSDLGTDLDGFFALPEGTLGFDADFNRLPGLRDSSASDGGQFGLTLRSILPGITATALGVHYVRYHSRLPVLSGQTGDEAAVAATSEAAVAARAADLAPVYESTGLSPEEALTQATATAESLTLSAYANAAGYFVEYPEDVDMFGLTFNTATASTGTLLSGELSHHLDFPFQIDTDAVVTGALSPIRYTPAFAGGPLGQFGADAAVRGYERLDKTQAAFGVAHIFGPRLGATQMILSADAAAVFVHDFPDAGTLPLNATADPDRTSWGYRLLGQLNYNSLFGGLNLRPRLVFTHDAGGTTPGPQATFIEDRKSLSVGVGGDYIRAWTVDLSYTSFFDDADGNRLRDRDFVRFQISYSF